MQGETSGTVVHLTPDLRIMTMAFAFVDAEISRASNCPITVRHRLDLLSRPFVRAHRPSRPHSSQIRHHFRVRPIAERCLWECSDMLAQRERPRRPSYRSPRRPHSDLGDHESPLPSNNGSSQTGNVSEFAK